MTREVTKNVTAMVIATTAAVDSLVPSVKYNYIRNNYSKCIGTYINMITLLE